MTYPGDPSLTADIQNRVITTFDQKLIDDQLAYAAEIIKAFGPQGDVPSKIPEGTFDLSFVK